MYTLSPYTKGAGSGVNTPLMSGLPAIAESETNRSAANAKSAFELFMATLYHQMPNDAIARSGV